MIDVLNVVLCIMFRLIEPTGKPGVVRLANPIGVWLRAWYIAVDEAVNRHGLGTPPHVLTQQLAAPIGTETPR